MRHRLAALVSTAGEEERVRQPVRRRRVVGRDVQGPPERRDRLLMLALLAVELTEVDGRPRVGRVDPLHARERVDGLGRSPGTAGDEAEHVVGLGRVRKIRLGGDNLALGSVRIAGVEERDAEVQAGDGQARIGLERAPELGGGGGEIELLEARDADVVRAIGILACRRRRDRCGLRRHGHRQRRRQAGGGNSRASGRSTGRARHGSLITRI